jgi:Trypsin-like peptidase domain
MGDVGEYGFEWADVQNPLPPPFDALCAIRVQSGGQFEHKGTGSLLGQRIILTAAHAVDIGQDRHRVGPSWELSSQGFYAVQGLNKGNAIATKWIDRIVVPVEFPHSSTPADIALLRVKTSFSSGSSLIPSVFSQAGKHNMAVPGYPSHWDPAIADGEDIRIGFGSGGVLPPKPYLLAYSADTFAGHSGCPVFVGSITNPFSEYIGVHSDDGGTLYNVGLRFTPDVLTWVQSISAALLED